MKLSYFGHSSFLIESKNLRIITDPYNSRIGFSMPENLTADIVTISHGHNDHSESSLIGGNPVIVNQPGETEVNGIKFNGVKTLHDKSGGSERGENIIFKFNLENINLSHLGDLGHLLSEEEAEKIKPVDILMIPVGGTYTIDSAEAVKVIEQLDPKIILPMHYQTPDLTLSKKLEPVDNFLDAIKIKVERMDSLELGNPSDLIEQKIIVLNRKK